MMTSIENLPADTVGFVATGRITKDDYENVLIPATEAAFRNHEKVAVYYQIGPNFDGFDAGAMLDDALIGMRHLVDWKRVAVVTDVEWIANAAKAFSFLMPGKVKTFSLCKEAEARTWLTQSDA